MDLLLEVFIKYLIKNKKNLNSILILKLNHYIFIIKMRIWFILIIYAVPFISVILKRQRTIKLLSLKMTVTS